MDWVMIGAAILLALIGGAMLFSSTYNTAPLSSRFMRQLVSFGVALSIGFFMTRLPYHTLRRQSALFYILALAGIIGVSFFGSVVRGTTSRFTIAFIQLQPSEFMKIGLIIILAWLLSRRSHFSWIIFFQSLLFVGLPVAVIMLEPDLGQAMLLLGIWSGLQVYLGLPWLAIGALSVLGLGASAAAWRWLLVGYQKARLLVFLDPQRDPLGAGYNVVQALVALGSGRLYGRGLGHGPQSQLQFLPEQHTDFILASVGEELGFVGIAVILLLYGIILWRILRVAQSTRDSFGRLLATGAFFSLLLSLFVAAGMNMGLLPVTGIPLPLLSYGGSNLVSTFILLGITQSVLVYSKWVQPAAPELSSLT